MSAPEPTIRPVEFDVCCLPADHPEAYTFTVKVSWRGPGDRWAVTRMSRCLGADGQWSHEVRPSEREDEWKATHRFPMAEAIERAKAIAPHIVVNGWTVEATLAQNWSER